MELLRLAALSALLLAVAQAAFLRGPSPKATAVVPNATAAVAPQEADGVNLMNQEVDDTFSSDIDDTDDPESVYEATLRDEQVKAELEVDAPADTAVMKVAASPNASNDIESVYEETRKAGLRSAEALYKAAQKRAVVKTKELVKVNKVSATATAKPRANHIKHLMDTIAQKAGKKKTTADAPVKILAAPPVPSASMQVQSKRASTVTGKHDEAGVMDATAKIVQRGNEAASDMGDEHEVGIVGEAKDEESTDAAKDIQEAADVAKDAQETHDSEEQDAAESVEGTVVDDEAAAADSADEDADADAQHAVAGDADADAQKAVAGDADADGEEAVAGDTDGDSVDAAAGDVDADADNAEDASE